MLTPNPRVRVKPTVSAPSEAWRFWRGESPLWARTNHPPIPSVAVVEEVNSRLSRVRLIEALDQKRREKEQAKRTYRRWG